MERTVRRLLLVCAALACLLTGSAHAAPGFLVGVADDSLKWSDKATAQRALGYTRDLGIKAVRVTVPWQPGQTRLSVTDRQPVDRMILATWGNGLRVVLAVYGRAVDAPQTDQARSDYCTFVTSLLHRYPGVSDVVVWNEPNSSRFWRPQFAADGSSVAPAQYEALLARCYDMIHAERLYVNVIAASSPRGNDNPTASSNAGHSPVNFYLKMGEAYRASGRKQPIFDTVGHNPYPVTNSERPWTHHAMGTTIAEGDYDKLMNTLQQAFGGTGQPVPGQRQVAIWYMEQGFQTAVDPAKASLYQGVETDRQVLPPLAARSTSGSMEGPAPDQATQLADALDVAYCEPGVAAFFNFELADEVKLGGWQSGVLWTDMTPKPSYLPFKTAIRRVATGQVDCASIARAAGTGAGIGVSTGPPIVTVK
jgi:hypothetical protein